MQAVLCKGQSNTLKFHRLCCNEYKMLAVHSQITLVEVGLKIRKNAQYANIIWGKFIGAWTLAAKDKEGTYFCV